jgi:hypothetical protein
MNRVRYTAYRRVLDLVEAGGYTDEERATLKDAAEGILLSSDPKSEELRLLAVSASFAVDQAVVEKRLTRSGGAEMRGWLDRCGPTPSRELSPAA